MIKSKHIFIARLKHIPILVFVLLALSFYSCSKKGIKNNTSNYLYDNRVEDLTPSFIVYHETESLSQLYFQLKTNELLYVRENISQPFESTIKIVYEVYDDKKGKIILDSATNILVDKKKSNTSKKIIGKIPVNIKQGNNYFIKIKTYDLNKKVKAEKVIEINKTDKYTKQYFLLAKKSNQICFDNYVVSDELITINSLFNKNAKLTIGFYNDSSTIAKPPFSNNSKSHTFSEQYDSTLFTSINNSKASFTPHAKGVFLFSIENNKAFKLFCLNDNFPKIIDYKDMYKPIRYICTNKEYRELINSVDKREVIEDFWIRIGGTKEKARMLIKEYYNRILFANKNFSSYKEGWKTDKGMLSIVMGLPTTINRSRFGETWIYGTSHNMMMSLSFTFKKINTNITNNDYKLDRYRSYKDYWYRAVESWRRGIPYTYN